jgi:hypothetical protein
MPAPAGKRYMTLSTTKPRMLDRRERFTFHFTLTSCS